MERRRFLGLIAAVLAVGSGEAAEGLETLDLTLEGDPGLPRRTRVFFPRGAVPARLPLVVLLHGLAETASEELGVRAWSERYGLLDAHARLRDPARLLASAGKYLAAARAREIQAELARRPFRGLVMACPYTPRRVASEALAGWFDGTLLPALRRSAPAALAAKDTALAGCSLGGQVGIEAFCRRPDLFGAFAAVQGAFRLDAAPRLAAQLAEAVRRAGPRALLLETSTADPFRAANQALAAELGRRTVAHELRIPPGPHDQPWLREVGTLELLLWLDRLRG